MHRLYWTSLPDMKGDEVARTMKQENPGMSVILLTGFRSSIDPKRLEGFMYVFDKPADPGKIIEALRVITRNFD